MANDPQNNLILHEGFDYLENGELPLFTITDNNGDVETFFYGTSNFDYLGIFDGDGDGGADFNGNPTNGFNTYTGFDDNYLVASDIDGSSSSIAPPAILTWSNLNVAGLSNLVLLVDIATQDTDNGLDFDDFVKFEYRVDGGLWQNLLAFETADNSSFNQTTFLEDTDFDGIGDGVALTSSAQTFSKNFTANGNTLDLRLQIRVEAGFEDIGIDNIILAPLVGASLEITATDAEKAEGDTGVTEYTFTVARSSNTTGEVSVDYTVSGDVDGTDFGGVLPSGTITFADGETSKIITLSVTGDTDSELDETLTVTLSNATNNATITVNSASGKVLNDDINLVKIHEIQGNGAISPVVGQQFAIEAIVTGDFQGDNFLRGFYVQEEDTDIDDNALTSEGIFVFDNNFGVDVNVGDKVCITGEVSEFFGETQFNPLSIQITGTGSISPTEVMLPVATVINADGRHIADLEAYEGMLVNFPDTLTISEMFNLDRFGEFRAIQGDRAFQFTQINDPDVTGFDAHLQEVASRTITVDDGTTVQNPNPIIYPDGSLDTADSLRMGDTVNNLTGVVRFSRGSGGAGDETFRIMPTENPEFEQVNLRPETPEDVGGRLKVASFNPLNFFTTIDNGQRDTAIGQDPRGADDLTRFGGNPPASDNPNAEFERQLDKLLTTLVQLDADVIGLQELENYFGSESEAPIAFLVNALNERLGADIYAYVDPGMDFLGTDAIAVGAIYRQDTVRIAPNTTVAYLDDAIVAQLGDLGLSGEPLFTGEATSRVPLAVTFEEIATGETFTVAINHFKSKGSSGLNDPNNPNFDQLDGQGFWNFRRNETAIALNAWLSTNPTGSNDRDVLILGDLNSYAQEDPIKTLEKNYINLVRDNIGDSAYSYVFDGQLGTLDYVLASPRLAEQVTGVTEWTINSDEADAIDYNLDFGRNAEIFDGSVPYRTSDHDPVIVGLNLDDNLRVATFNASLNRSSAGELIADLSTPDDTQAQRVAEIIQRSNSDIILLNEFDYDQNGDGIRLFQENYLGVSQNGVNPVEYPYVYFAPSNTGIASGFDLDNNGTVGGAGDAFGFGNYEGQYGMVLLSKYPIMEDGVRTFQEFLWKDMPNNLLTNDPTIDDPNTEVNENLNGYYSPEEIEILRLSSKSHWDIPVNVNGETVHILAAHPTPPVFDGTEDRNGKRNYDEIRFWSDYVNPTTSDYIYDDQGNTRGLSAGERFVIVGDYNADPFDGDSFPDVNASDEVKANYPQAITQLLDNSFIQGSATYESITPTSEGGVDASIRQNGANNNQIGNPAFDTADFGFNFNDPNNDNSPGNLRVDYVLPSYNLEIVNAEVFWKPSDDPLFDLAEFPTSDHRLVYVDLNIPTVNPVIDESLNRRVVSGIEFLGEVTFATGTEFDGTVIGGLSGIVFDRTNDVYYSIADDRSQINPARFYDLTIDLADGSLDDGDITFTDVTTLLDQNGNPFPELSLDPEGITLTTDGNLYISSEGDANALIAPFVNKFNLSGLQIGELPIDDKFLPMADQSSGIRNNLSFESATITPDGRYLYTATENALFQDGTQATLEDTSYSRIVKYDLVTKQVVAEYVYEVEPVAQTPIPENGFQTNGLVELLALDNNGTLLALERSFSAGVGNTVKLYQVLTQGALNVQGFNDLYREDEFEDDGEIFQPDRFAIDPFVIKKELLDFADLGITPDNLEGIALGEVLPDGSQSLIVVSDNNFSDTQTTQFIALGLDLQTIPAVLPIAETPQTVDDEDFTSEDGETVLLGDSDDPAVWIDKENPNNSIIVATLKDGGLVTFNLDGTIIEEILPAPFGDIRYNNVDVLYDFNLNGEIVDLAVASDRENDTLGIFKIDPTTRQLINVVSPDIVETIFGVDDGEATAYGLGGYKSPITGNYYVFVTQADGNQIAQLELKPDGNGLVTADVVRIIDLPVAEGDTASDYQSEAIVVDQERGIVYVGVEAKLGIIKFNAEPFAGNNVAIVSPLVEEESSFTLPYENIIVFGDSLADVGNVNIATNGAQFPSPPYNNGRATNGLTIVELIAQEIGLDNSASIPFLAGGDNYAFGGAELGIGNSTLGTPNVGTQIGTYLQSNTPQDGDIFFIFAGGNNILFNPNVTAQGMVDDLIAHITTLAQAGAQSFAVLNSPPVDDTPFAVTNNISDIAEAIKLEYNSLLDIALDELRENLGVTIYEFDAEEVYQQMVANASVLGITDFTNTALNLQTLTPNANPDQFFWWDATHPTGSSNEIFADVYSQQILQDGVINVGISPLLPDLEGLGIYYGKDGSGYLIASSQGNSSYALYRRDGDNEYIGNFIIGDNRELGIDQVNETDGLDIVNVSLGDKFPFGLLIVQDGANDPQNVVENDDELENNATNFKLVPWENVANAFEPILDIDTESFDPMNITTILPNGVASGDVTQDSAVLWARSTVIGDLTLELATDLSFATILNTITLNVTDSSLPVKVQIDNLEDNTEYFYRAIAPDGTVTGGRFVTASALGEFNGLSFGVTGDWRGELSPYPAVSNVAELELDFFVQHGDTIYADYGSDAVLNPDGTRKEQVETLEEYRAKHAEVYGTRLGQNYWAEVRSSTSILATIDDHEVINDFAGGELASSDDRFSETEGLINDTQLYENGLQAFQEYNPLRDEFYGNVGDERFDGERKLYRSETYGSDGAVMIIDTRSFRDEALPTPDFNNPEEIQNTLIASLTLDRTLLGETQLEDLKQDLLDAEANGITWKFVMIPEPIQNILPGITVDSYEGYGKERTELLKFIQENNIQNVVFVAADVHSTYVNNLTYQEITPDGIQQVPVPVFEITTGSVAFDQPTGEILAQIVLQQDPSLAPFYNSLPIAPDADDIINDKDDFVKSALNQQTLAPFGFDPLGLNNNLPSAEGLIDAELLQGDYYVGHTFGWTQFDIDADTQQLLITTYGIEPYSEEELLANPDEVLSRQPFVVSQFAVNPNNEPITEDDTVTTNEDTLINIDNLLDNDSDIDGDNLVIQSIDTTNTIGLVTLNDDGTVTYNPQGEFQSLAQGETATTTFEYTITDNRGGVDTAIVTVTIEGVNDDPIAVDDELTIDEDTEGAIAPLTNDTDIDGDTLTITQVTNGENGTVTNNNGTVTYTPNADFNGEDSFTYTISDGNGGTDTATVTVTVNPVNNENINFDDEDKELNLGDDNYTITGGNGNNIITTGNGNNTINLGNGNNQVTTGEGDDNITTGSGSDRIDPAGGNNIVNAGAGDDVIIGSGLPDINNQIDGGDGFDTVVYNGVFDDFSISVENGVVTVGINTDTLINVEQLQFSDRSVLVEDLIRDPIETLLNDPLFRFQNSDRPSTYLFVGETESENIRQNFPNFVEEGFAFNVSEEGDDQLMRFNRFQNSDLPGTYLFAGEEESESIRQNYPNFVEEGIGFYALSADANLGSDIYRFQNTSQPGTYIFVGEGEKNSILANFPQFTLEGVAFEVLV